MATTPTASSASRLRGVDVVVGGHRGGGGDAPHLDGAVVGAQDRVRGEAQVVQAAAARRLEAGGGLAGDAADLLGGQPALLEELGEGVGVVDGLLDEERDALGAADVEHAHEAVVVEAGGPAGGVEGGVGVRTRCSEKQTMTTSRSRVVSWADQRSAFGSCSSRRCTA